MKNLVFLILCLELIATSSAAFRSDIEFASVGGESLRLDAFVPDGPGPFPAVILVHGGGWTGGDKSGGPKKAYIAPMHEPLGEAGFAWFSINYRLAPKHPYPACIEDVEAAIRWVKANAAEYRIDPQRIALSGESAGAHLVALAVSRGEAGTRVAAVVPFYGRFDLTEFQAGAPLTKNIAALSGRENFDEQARVVLTEASPLRRVKRGSPPFLLVHGTADATVPFQQSVALQQALQEAGVPCELIAVEGGVHGMISWDAGTSGYKSKVVAWLTKTLGKPGAAAP